MTIANPWHAFRLRPRLLAALGLGLTIGLLLPGPSMGTRLLLGWCLGAATYVGLVLARAGHSSGDVLQQEASRLDDSAPVISLFAVLAAAASVGAVAMLMFGQREQDAYRVPHVVLAVSTLVCAWAFVQTVFATHYAHVYYGEGEDGHARGGLGFPGDEQPDFWDFLYFAVTIGAAAQTSDTAITSKRMRRIASVQTVYAYLYNTSLLALAVNMAAGFAQH